MFHEMLFVFTSSSSKARTKSQTSWYVIVGPLLIQNNEERVRKLIALFGQYVFFKFLEKRRPVNTANEKKS